MKKVIFKEEENTIDIETVREKLNRSYFCRLLFEDEKMMYTYVYEASQLVDIFGSFGCQFDIDNDTDEEIQEFFSKFRNVVFCENSKEALKCIGKWFKKMEG
jgi:hypothetical protein